MNLSALFKVVCVCVFFFGGVGGLGMSLIWSFIGGILLMHDSLSGLNENPVCLVFINFCLQRN